MTVPMILIFVPHLLSDDFTQTIKYLGYRRKHAVLQDFGSENTASGAQQRNALEQHLEGAF